MANWSECVIDASMGCRDGMFCFCPIVDDSPHTFTPITSMNYISDLPPQGMYLVAIVHPDGIRAVEQFMIEHREALDRMKRRIAGEEDA